jgi:3-carboxy-cis,cis-muconate cycloisomerase
MSLAAAVFDDPEVVRAFSTERLIAHLLAVEVALAEVQSALGIIPAEAAQHIAQAAATFEPDIDAMDTGLQKAGVPTIALIKQLRAQVDEQYEPYVHWGATSQDIMDTALILQLRSIIAYYEKLLTQLIRQLARLADQHRETLMVGRTHSQQALPTTFGLKVAVWLAPLIRQQVRLAEIKPRLLVVEFAGAVGTLASLGSDGLRVQEALAEALGLGIPVAPWHTSRDTLAEFAGWLSLLTGSLAKMAQDIILMAQTEVGELQESADPARGGSSTMPQKRNPIISETIIAAARANASLLATMHQTLIQEHERATHGWQMEWLTLPQMASLTGAALNKAIFLSENLVVKREQMENNLRASKGLMLAEPITLALAPVLGRHEAHTLVKAAVQRAIGSDRHLIDEVRDEIDADLDWNALRDEGKYLGETTALIDRVLAQAAHITNESD